MGQELSSAQNQELTGMKTYTGFSPKQVEMIRERFELICDEDQTVDKETFAKILKISAKDASIIFQFFDMDGSGRVDSYEFICGLALLSQSTLQEKAEIIFNLYDFDKSQLISKDELVVLMKTVLTSLNYMAQKQPPTMKEVETRANDILKRWDTNKDGSISRAEFISFVTKDPDILKLFLNYGLVNKEELRQDFGGASAEVPDCDSDLEDEINHKDPDASGRTERIKAGIEYKLKEKDPNDIYDIEEEGEGDQFMAVKPWVGTVKASVPTNYAPKAGDKDAPEATLDLKYVHGYRCHDVRNNLRYTPDGNQVVYHTAAVGVVLDPKTNTQKFCIEHTDDITCLDTYQDLVVTGQMGAKPLVVVWSSATLETKLIIQGDLQKSISQVCFSNNGKKLCAVANDDDHTIGFFDLEKLLNPSYDKRKAKQDGAIIIGKGPKAGVLDAKFDNTDNTVILTCVKEVINASVENGVVKCVKGFQWGKIQQQAVMCISFIDQTCVAGTFSGALLSWKSKGAPNPIQAHTGNVNAICARKKEKGIITGGNDGLINIWDHTIKKVASFDLKSPEIKSMNPKVRSVCENAKGAILVGTRGGEIVEFNNGKVNVLMRGHFDQELWGLAVHPSKNEYVTVGEDQLLASWDINTCKQKLAVKIDYPAKVLAFSKDDKFLAVGCVNGFVLIVNPTNFAVIQTLKDRPKEISELKFSPNCEWLAVGAHDSQIFIYNVKKNFKIQSKMHGHHSTITHFDFSQDSNVLQSNCTSYELLFFDPKTGKKNASGASMNKDEHWATWTCTIGWPVMGIWPECSDGSDINSVDRHPTDNILATADDFSKVKLFKYPCPQEKSSFNKFVGHASHVTNVRFSSNGAWLLSTGGNDKSIFQWRYNFDHELDEQVRASNEHQVEDEDSEKKKKQAEQHGMFEEEVIEGGDEALAVKAFKGEVINSAPKDYKAPKDAARAPDGNLTIKYCHGYRCFDAKNTAKYVGASDKVVFVGAALGVTMDIKTKEQAFFQMHEEDIICLAVHPNGKYAATGQMAQKGKAKRIDIFVWDMENKSMLARINDFHLRAVAHVCFSSKGDKLLSIGRDDDNSLAIYDWQQGILLGTAKVDKNKVTGIAYKTDNDSNFITVGVKHVKFWTINGKNITPQRGTLDATQQNEAILSCGYLGNNAIVGTQAGNLIPFSGNAGGKSVKAHQGGVWSICSMGKGNSNILSGGADGKVIIWSWSSGLNKISEYCSVAKFSKFLPGVTSIDVRADGNTILVGTVGSEIYEVQKSAKETLLLQGHYEGELWGCAVSTTEMKYVTCGGDKTIRLWDAKKFTMLAATKVLENDVRGVDWSPNGKFVIAADVKGKIMLLDPKDLTIKDSMQSSFTKVNQWIEDIKVSPDNTLVAFGAHGGASAIEIMSVSNDSKLGKISPNINCGLTSALLHLDWSTDSSSLVCNSQAYELKFINVAAKKNMAASASRDIDWASWTCKIGWPVQGIFQSVDYTDVNTVCRAGNKKILATGDDNGKVNLFKYPCTVEKSQCKAYIGHSSHVTRVKFTFNDSRVISTGGNDKCVLVWDTDFGTGKDGENAHALDEDDQNGDDYDDDNDDYVERKVKKDKYGRKNNATDNVEAVDEKPAGEGMFEVEAIEGGDEFMAVKPWLGAIREPTGFKKPPLNQNQPPMVNLTLDYVHGYRAKDCRNNLRYLKNGNIVYHAAALGIVLDTSTTPQTQRFFNQHIDDITAMDVHPNGVLVATGEIGPKPSIYVWDSNTMQVIHCFKGLTKGIASLSFSKEGKYVAGVAIDTDHYIAVYDNDAGAMVCMDKGDTARIVDLKFKNENEFVSVGPKHFKAWNFLNKSMSSKKGQFGNNNNILRCLAWNDATCLVGAADGALQVWSGNSLGKAHQLHKGGLDSIWVGPQYIVTGGADGTVAIIDKKSYAELSRLTLDTLLKNSFSTKVRSACFTPDCKNLLIGTYGSEIYELPVKELKPNNASKFGAARELIKGHYTPNQKWTNEVWGLANFNKDGDKYATCSDDATIRIWSSQSRKQLKAAKLDLDKDGKEVAKNAETGDLDDCTKGRSLDVSPDDKLIAVGCKDGTLRIFEAETLKQIHVIKLAKEWVQELKFSPDGTQLAVGSHDNAIYIFSVPDNFKKKFTMKKHSSFITHLDWSEDGTKLHSNCGAYELLFWDSQTGKQITSGATQTKDERWATWTCVLGWPVQGIWPPFTSGDDINYVSRSSSKTEGGYELLASADDFGKLKVFRYPCIQKGSEAVVGSGHSSHVTCCKFNHKDDTIFTTGGEDNCVFQWKVEPKV